jgi:hypothetical protein
MRVDRGHVDDHPAAALGDHLPCGSLHAEEGAPEVHGDDLVEVLLGDVEEALVAGDAGIVDHDVEPAERFDGCGDGALDIRPPRDVRLHGPQPLGVAELRRRPWQGGGVDIGNHDLGPVAKEALRAGPADPARRARDHCDLASQPQCPAPDVPSPMPCPRCPVPHGYPKVNA